MTRPIPAAVVAASCLLSLGACTGVPAATVVVATQAALAAASEAYCTGTTEEAKRAVRAGITGGVQVLPCAAER